MLSTGLQLHDEFSNVKKLHFLIHIYVILKLNSNIIQEEKHLLLERATNVIFELSPDIFNKKSVF